MYSLVYQPFVLLKLNLSFGRCYNFHPVLDLFPFALYLFAGIQLLKMASHQEKSHDHVQGLYGALEDVDLFTKIIPCFG